MKKNTFEIFIKMLGWHCISLGLHIDVYAPRIEIHFPFGFMRIGWTRDRCNIESWNDGLIQILPITPKGSERHLPINNI